jgi:hypothetical protein
MSSGIESPVRFDNAGRALTFGARFLGVPRNDSLNGLGKFDAFKVLGPLVDAQVVCVRVGS